MAWGHEIWDRIHVWEQSVDFGGFARWSAAIENKLIFKKKTDADGNVTIYKARLVAKDFRQVQGVDYNETFSPVAMRKSVRIMLAIATFYDYKIWQMDVKTAFLNGFLKEELYMMQPEGYCRS